MLHLSHSSLAATCLKTSRVVLTSLLHRWKICGSRGRCTFCRSHSTREDTLRAGIQVFRFPRPGLKTNPNPPKNPVCGWHQSATQPHPDAPTWRPSGHRSMMSGLDFIGHMAAQAVVWKHYGLGPGTQALSLRKPSQGCLERGHRRLVRELKKRFCLLDLESSVRRCCSS